MTDISEADEREAREWLAMIMRSHSTYQLEPDIARTILALLDRPRMPKPEDVTQVVLLKMLSAHHKRINEPGPHYECQRAAYRALYDHYTAPPAPKKVEAWAVIDPTGVRYVCVTDEQAQWAAKTYAGRIVRLVEVDSDN